MKIRWKNNLGLKLLALLFAILLWWAVANIDDPVITKTFSTTVQVVHPEVVTNAGKSYHIEEETQQIRVTVEARRSVTESIRAKDIKATADFRELQNSLIPIRITIRKYEGQYESVAANPQNLRVTTEDTQKKTFAIVPNTIGNVSDGYVIGDLVAKPQSIDISGPKTVIGRINKVVAKVDVSGLSESTSLKAELIYYDSGENIIDQSQLSSNCDKNGVKIQVKLLETKTISLKFDTSLVQVAEGYRFKEINVNQEEIVVCGEPEVLDTLQSLEIPAEALKQNKLKQNKDVTIDVSKYLPTGIELQDQDSGKIIVTLIVDKSGTKSILLPVRSVRINNLRDDLELTYGPDQEVELNFRGTAKLLEKLSESNIIATVDMNNFTEPGTYDVLVQILDMPEGCKYIGNAKIQVILSKKDNDEQAGE